MSGRIDAASRRTAVLLLGLATVYTLLNALKPLHVDDPFTFHVAQQIARAPLDPFGSEIYWYQWPQPVHEDLLAPVIAYWGALGLAVVGAQPFAWKLFLLPFALLFAVSLHRLARRFAPGLATWITAATLFSPAFLPSLNYMQDVPALALGLSALALYLDADERRSLLRAVAAGVVAGLAMQTKWTQLTIPAAIVLYGALAGRLGPALLAALAAAAVFAAWEAFVTHLYGHGMFLFQIGFPFFWSSRWDMVAPLVRLLGALLPAPVLLALAARGVPRSVLAVLALGVIAGWALLFAYPVQEPLFLAFGIGCLVVLVATGAALLGVPHRAAWLAWLRERRVDVFLIGWWSGEVATYFTISYFPAVRRVLAIVLVSTLVVGRAAARRRGGRPLPLRPLLAFQLLLGLGLYGVDLLEARAQRDAVAASVATIREHDRDGTVWFAGHWGFQFYAESLGLRPLVPDYSEVRRGDWLLVPSRVDQQEFAIAPDAFERVSVVRVPSRVPLASLSFYVGSTPIEHFRGPRIAVQVLRAQRDVVPETTWPVAQVANWAMHAGGQQARWARRALARALVRGTSPDDRALAARALAAIDPQEPAVVAALEHAAQDDPAEEVRLSARRTLATLRGAPP